MPQVPVYNRQQGLPAQADAVRGDVGAAGAAFGGLDKLADTFGDVADRMKKTRQAAELERASSGARRELLEAEFVFGQDTDYATQPDRFKKKTDEIRAKYLEQIGDTTVRTLFSRDFDKLATTKEFAVRSDARKGEIKGFVATLDDATDSAAALAARARNDIDRKAAIDAGTLAIDRMAQFGVIDSVDAGKRKRKFLSQVDEANLLGRFNGSEDDVNAALTDLRAGKYSNLDEVAQERLVRAGQARADALARERIATDERAERLADRTLKRGQAKKEAEIIGALAKDPDAFGEKELAEMAARQEISDEGYRAVRAERMRRQEGVDNPAVVVEMQDRMIRDGEDIHGELNRQRVAGQLSSPTYGRLLAENQRRIESKDKEQFANADERRAYDYLSTKLGKDKLMLSFDDDTASRLADGRREFFERTGRGETPQEVADDIVAKYQRARPTPPAIGYGIGAPQAVGDIVPLGNRLRALRDAGKISTFDYKREMTVLRRWQEILQDQPVKGTGK